MTIKSVLWPAAIAAALHIQPSFDDSPIENASFLDEIIVTATREEERIFDVPVSVSVINRAEIEKTETSTCFFSYWKT